MSQPHRSAAPVLPRQAAYGQSPYGSRPYTRPAVNGGAPMHPRPMTTRPAAPQPTAVRPMTERPVIERPAPRPAVSFLTVAEVAAIMRVSKMTVYRLVHAGEMASVRVGRSFRVPEATVREYLTSARTDVA